MNISVFCGSSSPKNEEYAAVARALGRRLADEGHTLLYGGSNLGLMGEVSGAAMERGGTVVAVIPTIFSEAVIRSQPVTELVRVSTMAERKEYLIAHSDAFVALPGGIGTLDEVSEVMVANQLQHLNKPMVLLNLDDFYDPFLAQLRVMHDAGFVRHDAETALHTVASVEELFDILNQN
ncbi:MAG: TIGR00730 family Rossman fold protein [Bacteroidales bacterium]|nr:TIGR00730 family Rossman fold protein [Bacteroidales bacterium]